MSNTLKRAAELLRDGAYDCVVKCHHDEYIALASELERMAQVEPVAWKHDCAALLMNDVELWVNNCPHCGKPRTTNQPAVTLARDVLMAVAREVHDAMSRHLCGGEQAPSLDAIVDRHASPRPPSRRKAVPYDPRTQA